MKRKTTTQRQVKREKARIETFMAKLIKQYADAAPLLMQQGRELLEVELSRKWDLEADKWNNNRDRSVVMERGMFPETLRKSLKKLDLSNLIKESEGKNV